MSVHTITLPVPDPFFQICLSGLFLMHAVFMNMVLGGAVVMFLTEGIRWTHPHSEITRFAGVMAARLPAAFALAVILGLVSLIGVQVLYGSLLNEAIGMVGNLWFCAGVGLLAGYGGLHVNKWRREWFEHHPGWLLLITGVSALGFLGVTLVFVVMSVMMLQPDVWGEVRDAGWTSVLALPSVGPRFLHMVCAAIAGAGMIIAGYGVYLRSQWNTDWAGHRRGEEEFGVWVTRFGGIWMMTGILPQIVVGPWLLMVLPDAVRQHLIAGDTFGSVAFFLALTSALFSLVLLNATLMVPSVRGFVVAGSAGLILTMGCMVIVRETVRFAWLTPYMNGIREPSEIPWGAILSVLALGILGGGYLWRRLCVAGKFSRRPIPSETAGGFPESRPS